VGVLCSVMVVLVAGAGAVVAALCAEVAVGAVCGAVVDVGAASPPQPARSVAKSRKSVANFSNLLMPFCIVTVSLLSFFEL
jgi:hypothetical protein